MTPDPGALESMLRRVALRLGLGRALRLAVRAALAGGAGLCGWAALAVLIPLPHPPLALAWGLAAGLGAAMPVLLWRLRPPSRVAARVVDRRLGLGDRLSTAVELLERRISLDGLARLQVADALDSARTVRPQAAAPLRMPHGTWTAAAAIAAFILWTHFLGGWVLPGTPASRQAAVIHREGRALVETGRRLDAIGRGQRLPETRRAADRFLDLGRRLEESRLAPSDALGLLRDEDRRLQTAQETIERRMGSGLPAGAGSRGDVPRKPASRPDAERIEGALRRLEALTGQLRQDASAGGRADLLRRLAALSDSLNEMNAPPSARRRVAEARKQVESGHLTEAAGPLGDAFQELQGVQRMLQDEQALGDARRQVQSSTDRIVHGGMLGGDAPAPPQALPEPSARPSASGSNPPEMGTAEGPPPPPGPNQGSLPGQGTGGASGAPTPRVQGTHRPEHLSGIQGQGDSIARDLQAPGRPGAARLPAGRPSREVKQQIDSALARGALPPDYLTIVRRYFEALGGAP